MHKIDNKKGLNETRIKKCKTQETVKNIFKTIFRPYLSFNGVIKTNPKIISTKNS